jgi:hypothetical protein
MGDLKSDTTILAFALMLFCTAANADTSIAKQESPQAVAAIDFWTHELEVDLDCWDIRGSVGPEADWCNRRGDATLRYRADLDQTIAEEKEAKAFDAIDKEMQK